MFLIRVRLTFNGNVQDNQSKISSHVCTLIPAEIHLCLNKSTISD